MSKELKHLAVILHVSAGSLNFMKKKNISLFFKKKMEILLLELVSKELNHFGVIADLFW